MSWDSPLTTRLFMGAAAAVFVAGWVAVYSDRPPVLRAPRGAAVQVGGELRDAVASPALPVAAGGWIGAAALGRAARIPAAGAPAEPSLLQRATNGRAVFSVRRAIVDRLRPGVPEPALAAGR